MGTDQRVIRALYLTTSDGSGIGSQGARSAGHAESRADARSGERQAAPGTKHEGRPLLASESKVRWDESRQDETSDGALRGRRQRREQILRSQREVGEERVSQEGEQRQSQLPQQNRKGGKFWRRYRAAESE